MVWARIILQGAQSQNDFDHKSAWYVAIGYPPATDVAMREGYKFRFWTSFSPFDPWAEGTAAYRTISDPVNLFLRIDNADSVAHQYCYGSLVYSWLWS